MSGTADRARLPDFDLYAELGIPFGASHVAIEQAWRVKVQSTHPDRAERSGKSAATRRTARLNIAREWLIDPVKRARYDVLRRPGPSIEIPVIDPLGKWPERPRRTVTGRSRVMFVVPFAVSFLVLAVTFVLGVANSVTTIVAFGLAVVTAAYFALFALVGVVYRAWHR